jgi:hypothetical protein
LRIVFSSNAKFFANLVEGMDRVAFDLVEVGSRGGTLPPRSVIFL